MAHPAPAKSSETGPSALARALFLAGLALWAAKSLILLPYWYRGLHYVSSLEWGYWGTSEWVHPIFVPLLGAYRFLLGLLGYSGGMLLPLEGLNLAAGGLTLALVFRAAERAGGNSWTAAAGTLMLAFSRGFWSGTLRPDPYALGAAASVLTFLLLAGSFRPANGRRFALAGLAAGLTTGLHTSGLSLAPLAAWAAFRAKNRRALGRFAAAMGLTVVLCYAAFLAYNGIGPDYFRRSSFPEVFSNIEQEAGTSLYTSRDPLKQVLDYHGSLHFLGAAPFLVLGVVLGAWAWFKKDPVRLASEAGRPAVLALLNFGAYSLFFLINNTHNKFIYAAWVPLPIFLSAAAAGGGRAAGLVLAGTAGAFAVFGAARGLGSGPADDPIYAETRHWDSILGNGDFLILPGCPPPEAVYGRPANLLPIAELSQAGRACLLPSTPLPVLPGRIREALGRGAKVYFPGEEGDSRDPAARAARRALQAEFEFFCGLPSPHGRTYCRLSPKPGRRTAISSPSSAVRSLSAGKLRGFAPDFRPGGGEFIAAFRARYLREWLSVFPEDAYAKRDLLHLFRESSVAAPSRLGRAEEPKDPGRQAPASAAAPEPLPRSLPDRPGSLEELEKAARENPRSAGTQLLRGELLAALGRKAQALAALDKARSLGLPDEGLRRAAWAYQELDACPRALEIWSALVLRPGVLAKDFSDKAVCEFRSGAWENAVQDLRRAVEFSPPELEAYASLGAIYSARGMNEEALDIFDRGLRRDLRSAPGLARRLAEGRKLARARMSRRPGP
mgnify:FL=1